MRPRGHPGSLLADVPVVGGCPGELLPEDADVAIIVWPDVGGLVLGPYGGMPEYPVSGRSYYSSTMTFTNTAGTQSWQLSNPTLSLTLNVTSYVWILATLTMWGSSGKTIGGRITARIDGADISLFQQACSPAANYYMPITLAGRSDNAYAAGTHTISLKLTTYQAGWVQKVRFVSLCAWAWQKVDY